MPDNKPYESEREASVAARSVIPPEPGWSILSQPQRAEVLHRALADAGVETSEYEDGSAWWLGNWSDELVAIIARWVTEASKPPPGTVAEWGIRQPVSPGRDEFVVPYDPGLGENYARAMFPLDERHNPGAELVRREVTPWRLADEPATGEARGDA